MDTRPSESARDIAIRGFDTGTRQAQRSVFISAYRQRLGRRVMANNMRAMMKIPAGSATWMTGMPGISGGGIGDGGLTSAGGCSRILISGGGIIQVKGDGISCPTVGAGGETVFSPGGKAPGPTEGGGGGTTMTGGRIPAKGI